MNVDEAIAESRQALGQSDMRRWGTLCRDVEAFAIETGDLVGLLSFLEANLIAVTTTPQLEAIRVQRIDQFRDGFAECLSEGLAKARLDPEVKSLYFEYFYDGGDASTGNLFLCRSFDRDDDSWAAEFEAQGVVSGPSVLPWMSFDPGLGLPDRVRAVATVYVDGNLLVACLLELEAIGGIEYPFGFAQHDAPVTVVEPKR